MFLMMDDPNPLDCPVHFVDPLNEYRFLLDLMEIHDQSLLLVVEVLMVTEMNFDLDLNQVVL